MIIRDEFDDYVYKEEDIALCKNCGRDLLSWEVDTGYCDLCTEQWLQVLNERDDDLSSLLLTDEFEEGRE